MKESVSIFSSPASLPLLGIIHTWFSINKNGKLSRWEVLFRKNQCKTSWNYLHLNHSQAVLGIEIIPYINKYFWKSKSIAKIEGKQAKLLIKTIEKSKSDYPYKNNYQFLGPNSNTYVQWILNKFPKLKINLPWNSLGKGWKHNNNP